MSDHSSGKTLTSRHDRLAYIKDADGRVALWGQRWWAAFEHADRPQQVCLRNKNVNVYIELEDLIRRVCAEKEAWLKEQEL